MIQRCWLGVGKLCYRVIRKRKLEEYVYLWRMGADEEQNKEISKPFSKTIQIADSHAYA